MVQYRVGEHRGFAHHKCLPLDLAIALADTEAVYTSLEHLQRRSCERCQKKLEEAKRPLVAMAKYVGYELAMTGTYEPLPEIEATLRQIQEEESPPEGWPYDEDWLIGVDPAPDEDGAETPEAGEDGS